MDISVRAAGKAPAKARVGVDVFIDQPGGNPDAIATKLNAIGVSGVKLTGMSNRGTKVWPNGNPDTFWTTTGRAGSKPMAAPSHPHMSPRFSTQWRKRDWT